MNRLLLLSITSACVGLAGCASDLFEPQWLTDARAREAAPVPTQKIRSQDRFFEAAVPAKLAAPVALTEGVYHLQLDVGSESPVECFVYQKGLDPATSLSLVSDGTFESISEKIGKVDTRRIERVDAGAIGGSPYLSVDWLYRVVQGNEFRVGGLKLLGAQKQGRTVHCVHNELGYADTFRRVVRDLVESISYRKPMAAKPYFTQISTLTIKGMRVGVEHTQLTRDADGDTRVDVRTSLMMPVDSDTFHTSDTFAVEWAEPDGDLINQMHVESVNGELVTHLALEPRDDGLWEVSGTYQTKPISAEIRPGSHPTSWLGEALTLRRTLAERGIGSEITLVRWIPGADPTRLLDETLSIERKVNRDRYGARLAMAGLEADLVVDESGSVAEGSMDLGFGDMAFERVYRGGAF